MSHLIPNFGNGCDDSERPEDGDNATCKHCGVGDLEWIHTGTRWRLADSKGLHVCKPSADDFDVLD